MNGDVLKRLKYIYDKNMISDINSPNNTTHACCCSFRYDRTRKAENCQLCTIPYPVEPIKLSFNRKRKNGRNVFYEASTNVNYLSGTII